KPPGGMNCAIGYMKCFAHPLKPTTGVAGAGPIGKPRCMKRCSAFRGIVESASVAPDCLTMGRCPEREVPLDCPGHPAALHSAQFNRDPKDIPERWRQPT